MLLFKFYFHMLDSSMLCLFLMWQMLLYFSLSALRCIFMYQDHYYLQKSQQLSPSEFPLSNESLWIILLKGLCKMFSAIFGKWVSHYLLGGSLYAALFCCVFQFSAKSLYIISVFLSSLNRRKVYAFCFWKKKFGEKVKKKQKTQTQHFIYHY